MLPVRVEHIKLRKKVPNPKQSWVMLEELVQSYLSNFANAFLWIIQDANGVDKEVWAIHPGSIYQTPIEYWVFHKGQKVFIKSTSVERVVA